MRSFYKTFLILTAASYLFNTYSFSQEIQWQNTIGGSDVDILESIHQTTDGGYILGGFSKSNISGDKTENSIGTYDYWIVKTNSAGNIQWQNTIGGIGYEELHSISQTTDGGYLLGGYSRSNISGDKSENCIGGAGDYWIIKTDSTGNIQWQNTIGGVGDDLLNSLMPTEDGGYILGGNSDSGPSGDKTEFCIGNDDYWIVKIDSLGTIQWQNTIGGSSQDQLNSIKQTSDEGYILGGWSNSNTSGDKTENNWDTTLITSDYWIVKIDSSGNIQWQNTIGGSNADILHSIQQTADGGYILGGYSNSDFSGDKTENSMGGFDYWLVKTDSTGNILWQKTFGGSGYDYLYSVQPTTDGGYILGGYSWSGISGNKTESLWDTIVQASGDYWIIKTDEFGNIKWQNDIGGSNNDWSNFILQSIDGGYILNGNSNSDISGDKTENCIGSMDYWIVKLSDEYNLISGKLFIDANSNNVQDTGEPVVQNKMVTEMNTGRFGFSQNGGVYYVSVMDTGNYTVTTATINYYNPVPVTQNAYFNSIQQTDSLNDFAFQPAGVFNDLCIRITPLGQFRSGMNAVYMINYGNYGTTTLSPTVILYPYFNVSYLSANVTPTSAAPDSVVWALPALAPFQTGSILVTVNVNAGLPIGTLINSSVHIEPVANDANTGCNDHSWAVYVTGALDPNDILVGDDTLTTTQLALQPYLDYIIRFQNTGNDTCFNAKILNHIDTAKLQLNTLEFVASSHPVNMKWIPWERNMEFTFDNILLPDSQVNEPMSHGFVCYRIKPKSTLTAGDSILNQAAIYFDFNTSVLTNTASTVIVQTSGISSSETGNSQLVIYPNPAGESSTIGYAFCSGDQLKLTDLQGRILFAKTFSVQASGYNLKTSGYSPGIYFVEVITCKTLLAKKLVKQ